MDYFIDDECFRINEGCSATIEYEASTNTTPNATITISNGDSTIIDTNPKNYSNTFKELFSDGLKTIVNNLFGRAGVTSDSISKVIFNDPATIVIWFDGSKTIVKCQEGTTYDPYVGLAMCISKRIFKTNSQFKKFVESNLPKENENGRSKNHIRKGENEIR